MDHVLLVSMPFMDLERPNLGLSLLKALLLRAQVPTSVWYGTLAFAEHMGVDGYVTLCANTRSWYTLLVGEAVFSPIAFPGHELAVGELVDFGLSPYRLADGRVPDELREGQMKRVQTIIRYAREFIEDAARAVVARRPRIVGCTSTFQQHVPSLALLRRVRELDPSIVTMMGGANCETRMGRATHRSFPWVDFVVSGEADGLIVPLVRAILDRGRDLDEVPTGVLAPRHRSDGYPLAGGDGVPRATWNDLDSLPYPDFSDYFEQLGASPLRPAVRVGLPVETSRGCWWGAKHHCTFCGLNGGGMKFRSKKADRVVAEMESLAESSGVTEFEVVDNILDMGYFETVLPRLVGKQWNIFYEVKSNLRPEQMARMAAAGVLSTQPGIESLDSRVLALMDKGARAWQQAQYLRWARELGIEVSWNLLLDFPGERDEWYSEMADLLPLLFHLQPPAGVPTIRYDRYSPYFEQRDRWDLKLAPHPMTAVIYPLACDVLDDICYHFERAGFDPSAPRAGRDRVIRLATEWRNAFFRQPHPELFYTVEADGVRVEDTRPCAVRAVTRLGAEESRMLLACTHARPVRDLDRSVLDRLVADRFVACLDDRALTLAVAASAPAYPYFAKFPGGGVDPRLLSVEARRPRAGFERMFIFGEALAPR
jgi:ribosomal peptide maturation radical SAM protein 1